MSKPDHSKWYSPTFRYGGSRYDLNFFELDGMDKAAPEDRSKITISHPLVGELTVSNNYAHAKYSISKFLASEAASKYNQKSRGHTQKKGVAARFYKKACYLLRLARSYGFEFNHRTDHPLYYHSRLPKEDIPEVVREFYQKDHIYRALIVDSYSHGSWETHHVFTLKREERLLKGLLKPIKKMLATRKISTAVALQLSHTDKDKQQKFINSGKMCFASRSTVESAEAIMRIREIINDCGRTPSKDMKICIKTLKEKFNAEHVMFMRRFSEAGGVVPTSVRGVKKLSKDMHNRNSAVYRLCMGRRNNRSTWELDEPIPELEDIGATVTILKTHSDLIKEGQDMKHCVGSYGGEKGLFLHLERGEDRATLFCSAGYGMNQVRGPMNASNHLSKDANNKWMPILSEWVKTAKFKEIVKEPNKELPVYD